MSDEITRRDFLRFAGLSGAGLSLAALLPDFITRRFVQATLEFETCIPFIDNEWHSVLTTWAAPDDMVDMYIDGRKVTGETGGVAGFLRENLVFTFNRDGSEYGVGIKSDRPSGEFFYKDDWRLAYESWKPADHHQPFTVKKMGSKWVCDD